MRAVLRTTYPGLRVVSQKHHDALRRESDSDIFRLENALVHRVTANGDLDVEVCFAAARVASHDFSFGGDEIALGGSVEGGVVKRFEMGAAPYLAYGWFCAETGFIARLSTVRYTVFIAGQDNLQNVVDNLRKVVYLCTCEKYTIADNITDRAETQQ